MISAILYIYYLIAICFFAGYMLEIIKITLTSKETGEEVQLSKSEYILICLMLSLAWIATPLLIKED